MMNINVFALIVKKFFDRKSTTHKGIESNSDEVACNQQLVKALHKPNFITLQKRNVYSSFKGSLWW